MEQSGCSSHASRSFQFEFRIFEIVRFAHHACANGLTDSSLRAVANVILFGCFLLYVHYSREMTERRGYTLRGQLKTQYKSTQRAQINERKSADSKRRFTAYIFHEVRVPLNTAQLAISNLEATKIEDPDHTFLLSSAKSSLEMMSQVLNDVLDFTRMERGYVFLSRIRYELT